MMLLFSLLVQLNTITNLSSILSGQWQQYLIKYNKTYDSYLEEYLRSQIFFKNLKMVEENNKKYAANEVNFKMEINKFSDMYESEVIYSFDGANGRLTKSEEEMYNKFIASRGEEMNHFYEPPTFNDDLADAIDWRDLGAVTKVKDQGRCGSCWAFSATGAIEGQWFRKTNKLISLSEQHLIECSNKTHYFNKGCSGGSEKHAYLFVQDNSGIASEESYGYTAKDGVCQNEADDKIAKISGFKLIPPAREDVLKYVIANVGPVNAVIDPSGSFIQYKEGVYYNSNCNTDSSFLHAVLIVGYGSDGVGKDFYWVKNSWGTNWGLNGYIKMARNKDNLCGITEQASFPII